MAEINTRLHYKLNGVTEEIKCYTTLAEVQNQGIPVKVGGVAGYAKYGPASDANASRGNYKPPGGTAQRILKQAQVPYGEQAYTTPGTYTFTVPRGVTKVRVVCISGGASGFHSSNGGIYPTSSSFGDFDSGAPTHGSLTDVYGNSYPSFAYGYVLDFSGTRHSSSVYGKGGFMQVTADSKVRYNPPGYYKTGYVSVDTNQSISVVVGRGGTSECNLYSYSPGTGGAVLIAWGGDII